MLKYTELIQVRCTIEEKALFQRKGGSEAFRQWLYLEESKRKGKPSADQKLHD